ncbi:MULTISPECIES: type II toxin-antitoxin system RelE/ParE family toxin [Aequorivita]|uniref:Type II toxin-antitoxin system RelE/ParE family toxin n=2 Tax=Aequorivita TaxID=153265 RepID=A0AB35YXR2_9FLAO|nr:type II toxin-antitoxin system RelE/ParE family toxin [Aequorivita sp. Ant34-E75]WGF92966.1 type II toxin-antitoxin system RelE/ParE family toxin [Aequorivita sp. Ant34-E75]
MADKTFFSEDAKRDIYRAKCQYDLAQKGDLFLDDIFNTLEVIKLMPEAFQIRYDSVRIVALEYFSFNIHYELTDGSIKIYKVLHQRQNY